MRNGDRGTLKSDDRFAENADCAIGTDTRYASESCNEGRTYGRDGSADRYTDEVFGRVSGRNGRISSSAESITEQVGKANESFSRNISSEKETMEAFTKKLTRTALIPTAILVVWEVIRLFFSLIL